MLRFSYVFFFLIVLLGMSGCEKKATGGVAQMHWDRDMCERCKMAVSERKFAVQVIDPHGGRSYKFDDIGCAVLWLQEERIPWQDKAIIWITDAATGEWIDAKKAKYTAEAITPMAFGFAAYTDQTLPKDAKVYDFATVAKEVVKIEAQNNAKLKGFR